MLQAKEEQRSEEEIYDSAVYTYVKIHGFVNKEVGSKADLFFISNIHQSVFDLTNLPANISHPRLELFHR